MNIKDIGKINFMVRMEYAKAQEEGKLSIALSGFEEGQVNQAIFMIADEDVKDFYKITEQGGLVYENSMDREQVFTKENTEC